MTLTTYFHNAHQAFEIAELSSLVIQGELYSMGEGYLPIDSPNSFRTRLAVCTQRMPKHAVLDRLTAAWIYGALSEPPRKLHYCVLEDQRLKAENLPWANITNRAVRENEYFTIDQTKITTPTRTVQDLAFSASTGRHSAHMLEAICEAIVILAQVWNLKLSNIAKRLNNPPKQSQRALAQQLLHGLTGYQFSSLRLDTAQHSKFFVPRENKTNRYPF